MTAEKLTQRLQEKARELRNIVEELDLIPSPSLHPECRIKIQGFTLMADQLITTCDLITTREHAHNLLQHLSSITDPHTNIVNYHQIQVPFSSARMLLFQSYISMTWAICDSITTAISPFVCTKSACDDRKNPPHLFNDFIKYEDKKNSSYYSSLFLRYNYSWAIGVSYVIRNHFVHDGALYFGKDFFAGRTLVDGFDISQDGWKFLEDGMKKHKLNQDYHRLDVSWPWHRNNLLNLLELCNDQIDDALSCLVGWSMGTAVLQARYLLEIDISS